MNAELGCPTPEELQRLMAGLADHATTDQFAQHLENCPACTAGARAADSQDELLQAFSRISNTTDDPTIADLVDSLCQLHVDSNITTPPESPSLLDTSSALHDETLVDQVADELRKILGTSETDTLGRLGSFVVRRVLGVGGMGFVLAAHDTQLDREVAIKVMRPALAMTASAKQRFLREARAVAALEHPHVVPIYQVGEESGIPFFSMPILKGESLETKLVANQKLSLPEVIQVGQETAWGLMAAHAQGLIHRDVKPGNIWCEPVLAEMPGSPDGEPRAWRVKLLDFGLVRAVDDSVELTGTGFVAGTPAYMAPEQARGEPVDERSDLFSLGAVMFHACTGQRPFGGQSARSMVYALTHEPPPRVLELNPAAPPQLALMIERLLEKDPDRRIQSADEVTEELSNLLRQLRQQDESKDIAEVDSPSPQSMLTRSRIFALTMTVALLLAVGAWGVLTMLWKTDEGTIVVQLEDPNLNGATISVDGEERLSIKFQGDAEPIKIKLAEGPHAVRITKPGFDIYTNDVTLKAGKDRVLRVWLKKLPDIETGKEQDNGVALRVSEDLSRRVLSGMIPTPRALPGIRAWQLETKAPRGEVNAIAFSPNGTQIVCGTSIGHLRIYDVSADKLPLLKTMIVAHHGAVLAVDWSRDGKWIASGGQDAKVRLWEPNGDAGPVLDGHQGWIHDVAFRRDGQALAVAGGGEDIRVWSVGGGPLARMAGRDGTVLDVDWSPDDQRLASATWNGFVCTWKPDGELSSKLKTGHQSAATVAWAPDGKIFATAGTTGGIEIWEPSGKRLSQLKATDAWVHQLAWSDRGLLASVGEDSKLHVWDTERNLAWSEQSKRGRLLDVVWSSDGGSIAASSGGHAIHIRDSNGNQVADLVGTTTALTSVDWSTRGQIAVAGNDAVIWLLNESGASEHILRGHSAPIYGLEFNAEGKLLASAGWDVRARIWDLKTLESTVVIGSNPVRWRPGADELAYASGKDVRLWSSRNDRVYVQSDDTISTLAWTPDGTELTTGDFGGKVRHWNHEGALVREQKVNGLVFGLDWNPERPGRLAVASSSVQEVQVLDDQLEFVNRFAGHAVNVVGVQWSRDGKSLVSGGGDGALRLWNASGEPRWEGPATFGVIPDVCFAPDGANVASVSTTGTLSVCQCGDASPSFVFQAFSDGRWLSFTGKGEYIGGDLDALSDELMMLTIGANGDLKCGPVDERLPRATQAK